MKIYFKYKALAFAMAFSMTSSQAMETSTAVETFTTTVTLLSGPIAPPEHQIEMYSRTTQGAMLNPKSLLGLLYFTKVNRPGLAYLLEWGATYVNSFINADRQKVKTLGKILENLRQASSHGELTQSYYFMVNTQFALLMTDKSEKNKELLDDLRSLDWTNTRALVKSFEKQATSFVEPIKEGDKFFQRLLLATGQAGHCVVYYDPAFLAYETFNKNLLAEKPLTLSVLSTQGKKAHGGGHPETLDFLHHDIIHSYVAISMIKERPEYVECLRRIHSRKPRLLTEDVVCSCLLILEFSTNFFTKETLKPTVPMVRTASLSGKARHFAELINWAQGYIEKSSTLNPTQAAISAVLNNLQENGPFRVTSFDKLPGVSDKFRIDKFRAYVTVDGPKDTRGSAVIRFMPIGNEMELAVIEEVKGLDAHKDSLPPIGPPVFLTPKHSRSGMFSFYKDDMTAVVEGVPSLNFDPTKPREEELRRCLLQLLKGFYESNKGLMK